LVSRAVAGAQSDYLSHPDAHRGLVENPEWRVVLPDRNYLLLEAVDTLMGR